MRQIYCKILEKVVVRFFSLVAGHHTAKKVEHAGMKKFVWMLALVTKLSAPGRQCRR